MSSGNIFQIKVIEDKLREIIIVGAGGQARIVIESAELSGFRIPGIIDTGYEGQEEYILGYKVLGGEDELQAFENGKVGAFIAIGDNLSRRTYFDKVRKMGFSIVRILNPHAMISKYATIGDGVLVSTAAIINTMAVIGENTIINSGAIIEHETHIGKDCHIGPGTRIAGRVRIGDGVFVGIGTSVIDKVRIGDNCIIGAGSVVISDIPSNTTFAGVPARRIK